MTLVDVIVTVSMLIFNLLLLSLVSLLLSSLLWLSSGLRARAVGDYTLESPYRTWSTRSLKSVIVLGLLAVGLAIYFWRVF